MILSRLTSPASRRFRACALAGAGSRRAGALLGAVTVAVACSGCIFGSPASITSTAYFGDVGNLVAGAPVEMAGISVGHVQSIALVGSRAKVVLSLEKSAEVPSSVKAEAEESTVLGEEVVELVAPRSPSGSTPRSASLLANNSVINHGILVPGIEQFVSGGTAVLGSIGTSQLASLINAGGEGFGGQAMTLRHLIADLNTVMAGYASRSNEIRQLVGSMNQLDSSLAPHAKANAQALSELSKTVTILDDQSANFVRLLKGLDGLSVEGRSLLDAELRQINLQLQGLAGVTGTLNGQQQALTELLEELPGHNRTLYDTTVNRFSQVIDAIILCGLPDGGESSQPASNCHGAGALTPPGGATP